MSDSTIIPLVRGPVAAGTVGRPHGVQEGKGRVIFVGAGPGDADLITLRGYRALQDADVVLYDSLVAHRLLEGIGGALIYVGKRCGQHSMPQDKICELLVGYAQAGERVARLKGGDPAVFGRLGEELDACVRSGVSFELVPGVSSAIASPGFAGIPVTHRGVADSFVVVTAHRQQGGQPLSIPEFCPSTTVVLLMGKSTTATWQPLMLSRGYPRKLPLAFVARACTAQQRVVTGTLEDAVALSMNPKLRTPCTVVIGEVVSLRERLAWFEGRDEETRGGSMKDTAAQEEVPA